MRLKETIREDITKEVAEIFYPAEMELQMQDQMKTLWEEYLTRTYGPAPGFYEDRYQIKTPHGIVRFKGTFLRALFTDRTGETFIRREICPVEGLCSLADTLAEFRHSKKRFTAAINGELMKHTTVEDFVSAFPQLRSVTDTMFGSATENLPSEAMIDMTEIMDFMGEMK